MAVKSFRFQLDFITIVIMHPKDEGEIANSVNSDLTAPLKVKLYDHIILQHK